MTEPTKVQALPAPTPVAIVSTCCHLEGGRADGAPCTDAAEWVVYSRPNDPEDVEYTEACSAHLGALLSDAPEHSVFPLAAAPRCHFGFRGNVPRCPEPPTHAIMNSEHIGVNRIAGACAGHLTEMLGPDPHYNVYPVESLPRQFIVGRPIPQQHGTCGDRERRCVPCFLGYIHGCEIKPSA